MARVRTDNVFGTTTDNPLTAGATTLNSAGLANLAAVTAPDEAIITLDPNRVSGAPEIVVVTAHTGSATSATIVRGQFGTAAREHALGTEWVHGPIASNASSFVTAADDQGDYPPLGAWEAWTPAVTQTVSVTVTVNEARFTRIGRTIIAMFRVTVTGSGTAGGAVEITVPVTAQSAADVIGAVWIFDTSASTSYDAVAFLSTTGAMQFLHDGSGAAISWGAAPSIGLAAGDQIRAILTYEAAS